MPFQHPLIAVDLSDASETAARWVAGFLPAGRRPVLAYAVDVPEAPSFLRGLFPQTQQLEALAEEGATDALQAVAGRLGRPDATCEVRNGRPAEVLLAIATDRETDAIVLGPHGTREGLGQFVGSTAVKIARQAWVPVVVVRGSHGAARPQRVMVAVDDSPASVVALEWARRLAVTSGASLHAATVVSPVLTSALGVAASEAERGNALAQMRAASAAWLDARVAELPTPRPAITTSVHVGRPADELMQTAQSTGADVLVMGRNRNALNTVLGSVADTVLRYGTCTTVVIPG